MDAMRGLDNSNFQTDFGWQPQLLFNYTRYFLTTTPPG